MNSYYFTSESVTEGHPDKLCDSISDAILDAYVKQDRKSRVAVEAMASQNQIILAGQITSEANVDVEEVVRNQIREIGFDDAVTSMDYRTCKITSYLTKQSPDIALGLISGGAGDQGMMFGFACDETENYMPYAIEMAHRLSRRLSEVRKNNEILYLRPDGKTQVTVEYEEGRPKRIDSILISTQHTEEVTQEEIRKDMIQEVILPVLPNTMIDQKTTIYINPTGRFVTGGPLGDTGLTGRKIMVDTYGGYAKHGGGAFSGKDATKVDRSAAYMLRHIAKNIVANGLAKRCEIQISYAIGQKDPLSLFVDTKKTGIMADEKIAKEILKRFDLTPQGIISYLQLEEPIYQETTNYGHFGKKGLPWEKLIVW